MQRPSHNETAKRVARMLGRRIENKSQDVIGEDQFGFRRGKETEVPSEILERKLRIREEICACFVAWQKVFDLINWSKLKQILNKTTRMKIDQQTVSGSECQSTTGPRGDI
jgi:hypothetical protein